MGGDSMKGTWERVSWGAVLEGRVFEFGKFGDGGLGVCVGMECAAGVWVRL